MTKLTVVAPIFDKYQKMGGDIIYRRAGGTVIRWKGTKTFRKYCTFERSVQLFQVFSEYFKDVGQISKDHWTEYKEYIGHSRSGRNPYLKNNIQIMYPDLEGTQEVSDISSPPQFPEIPVCFAAYFDTDLDGIVYDWLDNYGFETIIEAGYYNMPGRARPPLEWTRIGKGDLSTMEEIFLEGKLFCAGRFTYATIRSINLRGEVSPWHDPILIDVPDKPKVNFSGTPRKGSIPLQVTFTNLTEGCVTSQLWRFGDGKTSPDQSPVHTYIDYRAFFDVKLTSFGMCDSKKSKTRYKYIKPSVLNWIMRTSAADSTWSSVCWSPELSLFVAVSDSSDSPPSDMVMTSPDGISWTIRSASSRKPWRSVCWSPELGLFVAVESFGSVMSSSDGINWTARSGHAGRNWRCVCWSPYLGLFIAVSNTGTGNRIMSSTNGIDWFLVSSPADISWMSVCWSPELGLFVAVARSGTGNRVMTSSDGVNWTIRDSAADNSWVSVCWSPELSLFVAVATTGAGNRVMTSPYGIFWTIRDSAADYDWVSVCWSSEFGMFLAVSDDGVFNSVMTSPNGISWTIQTTPSDNDWESVCWSPELSLFVAVASTGVGNRVMTLSI